MATSRIESERLQTQRNAYKRQPSQLASPRAADEDQQPPPAFPDQAHERQQLPTASWVASRKIQGGRCSGHRENAAAAAANSPSSKCRKVDSQVDGATINRQQSSRYRRP